MPMTRGPSLDTILKWATDSGCRCQAEDDADVEILSRKRPVRGRRH